MRYTTLGNTGLTVSTIALGGGQCVYNKDLKKQTFANLVKHAYARGIRHFDTSPFYGSEPFYGEGLRGLDRNSYVLSTKVGRYRDESGGFFFDFSAKRIEDSIKQSLELLQVPYIDIIQVHDFEYIEDRAVDTVVTEALPVLQKFREQGLVKCIGLASYHLPKMKEIIEQSPVKIDTVLSHSTLTIIDQELQDYMPFFKERGLGVMNAACLALGLLMTKRPLPTWIEAEEDLEAAANCALKMTQDAGMKIERLATGYTAKLNDEVGVDVFLTGADSIEQLDENIAIIEQGLTKAELDVCEKMRRQLFENLPQSHRNVINKDVARYNANLRRNKTH